MTSEEYKRAMIEAAISGQHEKAMQLIVRRMEEFSREMVVDEYTQLERPALLAAAILIERLYRNAFEQEPEVIELAEHLADSIEVVAAEIKFRPEG